MSPWKSVRGSSTVLHTSETGRLPPALSYELRFGMRAPLSFTVTRLDSTDSTGASLDVQVEEGATTTVQSPNARETHAGQDRVIPLLKKKDPRHGWAIRTELEDLFLS